MKNIAILGSTGSIGTRALQVIAAHPERFRVEVLTARHQVELLARQAIRFKPNMVAIADESKYRELKELLKDEYIKVYAGSDAIAQVTETASVDVVLVAMVGFSGLLPTTRAIRAGKTIALANKETLVVAGELISRLATRHRAAILPVDSEHSAIFQCLAGEGDNPVEKLILTASGGPFRGKGRAFLESVTPAQALQHPTWDMGAKVTIDSASLMNKGFEAIEACWLFGVTPEQIEVLVHPQSIIHSMVQFADGSVKAQMGTPDMRLPIQYALSYPERLPADIPRVDFAACRTLSFEKPDTATFPNLELALEAARRGGNCPCVLNAANEIAVEAFLREQLSFTGMSRLVEQTMNTISYIATPSLEDYMATDEEARRVAREQLLILR
ncbi:MAG: 1-deoxy-D-xylulose-5-phosphate reductoisomerase [Odoribacteraceae bacterium]|jgi:1-deoxy-D-xylulose-5-phosphate reductoisomerase|nr:1-deoxy-D-xylulose-5-phosphate reductoisomerase [Odoribacteraceae bacterium]